MDEVRDPRTAREIGYDPCLLPEPVKQMEGKDRNIAAFMFLDTLQGISLSVVVYPNGDTKLSYSTRFMDALREYRRAHPKVKVRVAWPPDDTSFRREVDSQRSEDSE
ncbi:MAG: hypothetical protein AB1644_08160 [Candidatus Zixiibacteriota bacterium]